MALRSTQTTCAILVLSGTIVLSASGAMAKSAIQTECSQKELHEGKTELYGEPNLCRA